jgi:hypothetical protein
MQEEDRHIGFMKIKLKHNKICGDSKKLAGPGFAQGGSALTPRVSRLRLMAGARYCSKDLARPLRPRLDNQEE